MCGRYVLFSSPETILDATSRLLGEQVGVVGGAGSSGPRPSWNIAPTHTVAVVRRFNGVPTLGPATWGYSAPWKKGLSLFNARGETVFDKPAFRGSEPCLFVMDAWYEWKDKVPYAVSADVSTQPEGLMVVAGLCRAAGDNVEATVVTTESVAPVEWLHDRMPRVLGISGGDGGATTPDTVRAWLDGGSDGDGAELRDLAASAPDGEVPGRLTTREVDRRVGNVAVNGPELLEPGQ